jgi:glycosyltransferase involved in cell wall biosynthesis
LYGQETEWAARFRPFWISGKATARSDELAQTPRVSVLISLVNFAENVTDLYRSLIAVLESRGEPFEVVCVDDGSQDDTLKQLILLADRDKRLRVIKMRDTFGESAALEAAFRYSKGNQIVYLSGRVRVNPATVVKLLDQLEEFIPGEISWLTGPFHGCSTAWPAVSPKSGCTISTVVYLYPNGPSWKIYPFTGI